MLKYIAKRFGQIFILFYVFLALLFLLLDLQPGDISQQFVGNPNIPPEAKVIMVTGSNTAENHPIIYHQVLKSIKNGGKLIVINPRKVGLCAHAHIYLQIKPGTDMALLLAWTNVIIAEKRYDEAYIKKHATGFDELDPRELTAFGYGRAPNVLTGLEFERLLCATGPTQGRVLRPSDLPAAAPPARRAESWAWGGSFASR